MIVNILFLALYSKVRKLAIDFLFALFYPLVTEGMGPLSRFLIQRVFKEWGGGRGSSCKGI